jgi:hypothetical protein
METEGHDGTSVPELESGWEERSDSWDNPIDCRDEKSSLRIQQPTSGGRFGISIPNLKSTSASISWFPVGVPSPEKGIRSGEHSDDICWHFGGWQGDIARHRAEDIGWTNRALGHKPSSDRDSLIRSAKASFFTS